jgi:hypothetical protein
MTVLRAWYELRGRPGPDETIIPRDVIGCEPKKLAKVIRDDLRAVGVTRALLFEENMPNVEPFRFHDGRATFCSWARRDGKSDAWISERTGHRESAGMINRYDRGAQTLADLGYKPFPDISGAIPELAEVTARLAIALATEASAPGAPIPDSSAIPSSYPVGAIGIEPTTPTVSKRRGPLRAVTERVFLNS